MHLQDSTDSALSRLFLRRHDVAGHSIRTGEIALALGRELGLANTDLFDLMLAAGLHDVGKAAVPPHILDKTGALTSAEWTLLRLHPVLGHKVVKAIPAFSGTASVILHHHERWDGQGYPHGLTASSIPVASRIISIADAFDAMTHRRTYRKQLSVDQAISELRKEAGAQFDPELVHASLRLMPHLSDQLPGLVGAVEAQMERVAAVLLRVLPGSRSQRWSLQR